MGKDNLKEKNKGIRLKGKRLEWWENNPDAAGRIREFIDQQIDRDKHIEQIKKAPPELLERLSHLVDQLDDSKEGAAENQKEVTEAENKIDSLISSD